MTKKSNGLMTDQRFWYKTKKLLSAQQNWFMIDDQDECKSVIRAYRILWAEKYGENRITAISAEICSQTRFLSEMRNLFSFTRFFYLRPKPTLSMTSNRYLHSFINGNPLMYFDAAFECHQRGSQVHSKTDSATCLKPLNFKFPLQKRN